MIGRDKPYTRAEIRKVKCQCGKLSRYQWNCCALDNRWVALCKDCDLAMNEMVLAFFRVKGRAKLMDKYRKRVSLER